MAQQELSSSELFGIAKRINNELEALPLHTHAAIVQLVTVGRDHRNIAMQHANKVAQEEAQERIIKIKEYEIEQQQKAQAVKDGAALQLVQPPN